MLVARELVAVEAEGFAWHGGRAQWKADRLRVAAADSVFVGDGANDELGGAARVGMTPVLFVPDGTPRWPALAGWDGLRIDTLPELLEIV